MSNPILNRLNAQATINDTATGQNMPLICLVTISKANQPDYYYVDTNQTPFTNVTYNALNKSYNDNTLVFNQFGSLTDIKNYENAELSQFFISPFDPMYAQGSITAPTPRDTMDVIGGDDNSFAYGLIGNFNTNDSRMGGNTFVSPRNSKWILNVTMDNMGNNIYKIFFNPLQNTNTSQTIISRILPEVCSLISNADPMCFCNTSDDICTKAAFSNKDTSSISKSNYDDVSKNCSCLNNQCRFAMANQTNNYVSNLPSCGNTSACGQQFLYSNDGSNGGGVSSKDKNSTVYAACGGTPDTPDSPPPDDNAQKKPMSTSIKVGIMIAVILVILVAAYFIMM